jgi:hypothetical protein
MKTMIKFTTLTLVSAFGLAVAASADDAAPAAPAANLPAASTKTGLTYATDIKPIFDASCVKCHSGMTARSKLHLDTLEGALKGNKDGKVIIVGDSAKSQMVLSVAHAGDQDGWMPPLKVKAKFPPLTDEQVGLIRAWIDQGAK